MYKLIAMSFDGKFKVEGDGNRHAGWETVEDAWMACEDMGSRWYFYPFWFVVTASGKTIVDSPQNLEHFNHKRVKTVVNIFELLHEMPEVEDADVDSYIWALRSMDIV
jgi:CO dehydrogenase/acetyl-CoA synthase delta subunit